MPRYPKKERTCITDYSTLPAVLQAKHIVEIMDCCDATAMKLIREWDKKGFFPVVWCGNSPRINRDTFLNWFTGGLWISQKTKDQPA